MSRPCQGPRDELIQCVLKTDCVLKHGKSPGDCIRSPQELPLRCQHLIANYSDCKKGMLDMRRRFRGNHLSDEAMRKATDAGFAGAGMADIGPKDTKR